MPPDAWAQLAAMREEVTRLAARCDALRRQLEAVQWCGGYGERAACPICYGNHRGPFKGHTEDCALAAALEGR